MHLAKVNVDLFLTRKRAEKRARRRRLQGRRYDAQLRARLYRQQRARFFGSQSLVGEMLSRGSTALPVPQTSLYLRVPSVFSMHESPELVLDLVSSFAATHRARVLSDVYVDFSKVATQDLGAHALLDKLVDEIASEANYRGRRIGWKGNYPKRQDQ